MNGDILRDLGDGLILRRAGLADREALAEFHAHILVDADEQPPADRLYYFVLDLMSDAHPLCGAEDFTVVEETATGRIVSSMVLMSQTWAYEGIPFRAGQPDIVSTDPGYRRRGLVRAQMEAVHRWSAERGELLQGITGIPWYYRQFGYEMALSLDAYRVAYRANVPKLTEGEPEPYVFRPATADDLPLIMAMYAQSTARSVVAAVRDEAHWRFDLERRHEKNGTRSEIRVIAAREREGEPVGLLIHSRKLWFEGLGAWICEVRPGVPWLKVAPSLLRELDQTGDAYARRDGGEFVNFGFDLGRNHPLYDTIPDRLPRSSPPYAWYLRVPDLPAFVSHIAPALERRLAASAQAGYSGELTLNFFRSGIRFTFAEGRIAVESWSPERIEAGDALFPDLSFLPLLFGFRSLEEIQFAYPDCATASDDARALLPVLFPKKDSRVWSGG